MKKKSAEDIMEEFYEEYQDDPEGWSFWLSRSSGRDDFYEVYIIHGDEAFFLKIDSVFTPNPVGIGACLGIEEDQLVKNLPDFGFRRFSREETESLLSNIPNPESYDSKEEFREDLNSFREHIVGEAMNRKPVSIESSEGQGGLVTIGPYSMKSPLSYVSEKQEELKEELSRELERLINRNYPGYY